MKIIIILFVWLATSQIGFAQVVGTQFPNMQAETVDDKKVLLPQDVKGKYTLLGLAYSVQTSSPPRNIVIFLELNSARQ